MTSRAHIGIGLAVFFLLGAYPVWNNLASGAKPVRPTLAPAVDSASGTLCVEDTTWMKDHHQELLNHWRTLLVRDGQSNWVSPTGKTWTIGLEQTCFKCHTNSETFCTRCHDYANVQPTCWNCHVLPEGGQIHG